MQLITFSLPRYVGSFLMLSALAVLTGCGGEANHSGDKAAHREGHVHKEGEAGHGEKGPHNGQLIELGKEEYHAEFLHDDAAHKITFYVLDGGATKAVPIAEKELTVNLLVADKPTQFKIPATPQDQDPTGQASRFELVNETLCEALDDPKSKARLNLTIAGKPFSGEMAHDDHDYDHKK